MSVDFNPDKQHTIAAAAHISGIGLHTGVKVNLTMEPSEAGFGYQVKRADLDGQPIVKIDCDNVVDVSRGTTVQSGAAKISTVEHLMAALVGNGVDNVLITVDGPEIPILDGSAQPFVELILQAGVVEQDAEKIWYTLDETLTFRDDEKDVDLSASPADTFSVTTLIDFNSPVLGCQYAKMNSLCEFDKEIANCRTFTFLHELEPLLKNNLIKGGDLDNAIVIVNQPVGDDVIDHLSSLFKKDKGSIKVSKGYLNNLELRYPNEPARHKLLDVVGDLALIGYPIKAKIVASKPGHSSNIAFAKMLKHYIKKRKNQIPVPPYDYSKTPVYDLAAIEKTLPHRYPFLLVDKIIDLQPTYIVGVKNVTFNEYYFQGHFPGNPIMPGVLQIEALAQTGGILCINAMNDGAQYDTYFMKIDNCKFKQMVKPGDTMLLKMELSAPIRRGICEMHGTVFVNGKVATEADLVAQIVKRK